MSQAQTSATASSSSSSSTASANINNNNDSTNTLPSPTAELGLDDYDPTAPLTAQTLNADGTPKRPMNAFMIFARKRRPEISAADAALRTGEISKVLSREWAAMTAADKSYFQDQARKLKDHFNSKYPDYVYRRRPNHSRRRRRASSDQSHLGNGTGAGDDEGRSASAESEESPVDDHSPGGASGTHSLSHHNSGQHGRMSSGSGGIYGPYPGSQAVSDILAPYRMPPAPTNGHGHGHSGASSWNLNAATVDRSDPSRGGSGRTNWPTVPPLSIGPSGGARYGSSSATNSGLYGSYTSSSASPSTYTPGGASSAQSQSAPSPAMSTLSAYSSAPAGGAGGYGGAGNRASWSSQGSVPSPYDVRASSTSSGSTSNGPGASPYDMRPPSSASNNGPSTSPFDLRGPPAPASLYTLGTSHSSSYGRESGYASGRDAPPQSHSPPGGMPSYSLSRMGGYGGGYGGASGPGSGGASTAQQHAQMAYQWGGRDVPLE